jgi:nucleoside phosphorylase
VTVLNYLVADMLIPYEHQRIGTDIVFRDPVPPTSSVLLNRFRHALDWSFLRHDGTKCGMHIGAILSGDKLVDDVEFKASLLTQYPNAIGGEMEGAGLWAAAARSGLEWIVAKAVSDWADGRKHDGYQELAAAAASSLAHHVLSDPHVLDGIRTPVRD